MGSSATATNPRPPMIQASGVQKWYGKLHVLRGIDLVVGAGEVVVTHEMDFAREVAEPTMFFDEGRLVEHCWGHGVAVRSGTEFGPCGEGFIRLTFAGEPAIFQPGLERLAAAMRAL